MHISIFFGILLSLAEARPNLHGDGRIPLSSASSGLSFSLVSALHNQGTTTQAAITSHISISRTTAKSSLPSLQTTTPSIQSTDVLTRTRLSTVTQTSFLPVSTLVTQAGSIVYYSTWLTVIHPTTVLTLTEYITGIIQPLTETITETIDLWCPPPMTYECICPSPVTATVYVVATPGSVTAITSATLVPLDSTLSIQSILTATMSMTTAKVSSESSLSLTASSSTVTDLVSHSVQSQSPLSSKQSPDSVSSDASGHDNSIPTSSSVETATISLVSEMSNGQLIIPFV